MNYSIDFSNYKSNFSLPSLIVDENFKDINSDYLKVILMIFKNPDKKYSINLLSNLLNLNEALVQKSISFWAERGILILEQSPQNPSVNVISKSPAIVDKKPSNDSELAFLLATMEKFLARTVTSTDLKTVTYIYEYYRLPADVILMAMQHSAENGNKSIKYVEKICIDWYEKGITSHTLAEEYLNVFTDNQKNILQVKKAFGIMGRNLVPSEEKFIQIWFNDFKYDIDIVSKAFEKTVQNTGKVAFAYTNRILENWYKNGYKNVDEIVQREFVKKGNPNDSEKSYDLDMLDEYWNTVPKLD